uniref:Uncharacterized protein n=1 Tax=Cacopsylla melanoneura TaxID=428564 RepID=A0A8D8ZF93_9HEMI
MMFSTTWDKIQDGLDVLIQKFRQCKQFCLIGIPPRFDRKKLNFHISKLNTKIKTYVKSKLCNLIYIDTAKILRFKDYAGDKLHLNRAGKDKLCNKLKTIISGTKPCSISPPIVTVDLTDDAETGTSFSREHVGFDSSPVTPTHSTNILNTPNFTRDSHSRLNMTSNSYETPMCSTNSSVFNMHHSNGYYRLTQRINLSTLSDISSFSDSPIPVIEPGTNRANNENFSVQAQIFEI